MQTCCSQLDRLNAEVKAQQTPEFVRALQTQIGRGFGYTQTMDQFADKHQAPTPNFRSSSPTPLAPTVKTRHVDNADGRHSPMRARLSTPCPKHAS